MKNRIRQIIREETSGFDHKMLKVLYQYMNLLTKDYVWYTDTPEQSFKWSPGSIWLINPETKQWVLQLKKDRNLWWYGGFYRNFQRYFNMEQSDFERFIKIWVEDVLNRGISATEPLVHRRRLEVEDVLNRGISATVQFADARHDLVEDVLNRGVSSTEAHPWPTIRSVDDVIDRGKELE